MFLLDAFLSFGAENRRGTPVVRDLIYAFLCLLSCVPRASSFDVFDDSLVVPKHSGGSQQERDEYEKHG